MIYLHKLLFLCTKRTAPSRCFSQSSARVFHKAERTLQVQLCVLCFPLDTVTSSLENIWSAEAFHTLPQRSSARERSRSFGKRLSGRGKCQMPASCRQRGAVHSCRLHTLIFRSSQPTFPECLLCTAVCKDNFPGSLHQHFSQRKVVAVL